MYAIIRVGDTHYGDLVPGMLIVIPYAELNVIHNHVVFKNPLNHGGFSSGFLVCRTNEFQDIEIRKTET